MSTDLIAVLESIVGPLPDVAYEWDGAPDGPEPDLFVSDNEAAYRQRQVDSVLSERWSR